MVSIVIPVYKVEKYINNLLISISKQTYTDFEVILINDGSPDSSLEIILEFQRTHPEMNIIVESQKNQGVSAARNHGISLAHGEYICFVDSDDMVDASYLQIMVSELVEKNADIAICKSRNISEDSSVLYDNRQKYSSEKVGNIEVMKKMLYGKMTIAIWSLLCKREIVGDLKFAKGYKYSEDLEMAWRLIASSGSVVMIDAPLYNYRVREGSAMAKVDEKRLDGMKLFSGLENFLSCVEPNFAVEFKKYGVARWVWSTVWQEAVAASSYSTFKTNITRYSPEIYMRRLFDFDNRAIKISSKLFIYIKPLYYFLIKIYKYNYRKLGQ